MNLTYLRSLYFEPFKSINKTIDESQADRHINLAYLEVYRAHRWNGRKRTGQVAVFPRYTTGTVSVTVFAGSNLDLAKTITFSNALDDTYLGRYVKFGGGSKWYKITALDSTYLIAYLDSPVVETPTDSTFEIWKRFYYILSDADRVLDFGRWGQGKVNYDQDIIGKRQDISQTANHNPLSFGSYGIDPYDDKEYSTGTVTINKDDNVATGLGTEWLKQGFDNGDIMVISDIDYFIKRVESNTKIVLYNYFIEKKTAVSYKLHKNNPIGFEFYNTSENYNVLPYTYYGRGYPLVHPTKDRIGLSDKFIPAIISRAQYFGFLNVEDPVKRAEALAIYVAEMNGLKSNTDVVDSRYDQFAPVIHPKMPGRG